jgi:hypothetical protein
MFLCMSNFYIFLIAGNVFLQIPKNTRIPDVYVLQRPEVRTDCE